MNNSDKRLMVNMDYAKIEAIILALKDVPLLKDKTPLEMINDKYTTTGRIKK